MSERFNRFFVAKITHVMHKTWEIFQRSIARALSRMTLFDFESRKKYRKRRHNRRIIWISAKLKRGIRVTHLTESCPHCEKRCSVFRPFSTLAIYYFDANYLKSNRIHSVFEFEKITFEWNSRYSSITFFRSLKSTYWHDFRFVVFSAGVRVNGTLSKN